MTAKEIFGAIFQLEMYPLVLSLVVQKIEVAPLALSIVKHVELPDALVATLA